MQAVPGDTVEEVSEARRHSYIPDLAVWLERLLSVPSCEPAHASTVCVPIPWTLCGICRVLTQLY